MKILVLNGSPKGAKSNTYRITTAFLDGVKAELGEAADIGIFDVYAAHIEHCKGCFGCWTSTPGRCVIRDDMDSLLPEMEAADLVIWSFPLYYFGMPSKVKALVDRNLPTLLPFMAERPGGGCAHPRRHEGKPAENILISTCGFYSTEHNYEALIRQFDILFGEGCTKILCPEGELFSYRELDARTGEYLSHARQAGREYARKRRISQKTQEKLQELLFAPDAFTIMADASWDIQDDAGAVSTGQPQPNAGLSPAERFTRQMAATYNPASFDGTERIFEIYYTDVQAGYQLVMGSGLCEVRAAGLAPYTTRVETPLPVWQDIARGVCDGAQAMMEGKYRTLGDLNLLISWERYFGPGDQEVDSKTNMALLLLPWMVIWTLPFLSPAAGGIAGICAASCLHLASLRWELTVYDAVSCFCVSALSLLMLLGLDLQLAAPLSYLCFGVMWLLSCFTPVPLTAHYSNRQYGGSSAFHNPLFMKTNRILTACWSALYLATPVWTYVILGSRIPYLTAVVNTVCPAALGLFTGWFQKWYPSKVAGRRSGH